jgi:uroporphyrinogen-III synthase
METPLSGLRILVPPSRLDRNPLIVMLQRNGAEVVVFPSLEAGPVSTAPIAEAAARVDDYDWVVFGGGESVENLCNELEAQGRSLEDLQGQTVTIGASALGALRKRGRQVDHRPRIHTADGVVEGMLPVEGQRVLILRGAPAREKLPALLAEHGARVDSLIGHTVKASASPRDAASAFARRIDLLALANPGTAEAAEALGLVPDLIAAGRLKHLVAALVELAGRD